MLFPDVTGYVIFGVENHEAQGTLRNFEEHCLGALPDDTGHVYCGIDLPADEDGVVVRCNGEKSPFLIAGNCEFVIRRKRT